jgi:beta-N-acetylhexosaminidase
LQLATVGTADFSKSKKMKIANNLISILGIFLLLACSTKKTVVQQNQNPVAQQIETIAKPENFDSKYDSDLEKKWVDSVYNKLTFEERLGQLFMVSAYSNKDSVHFKAIDKLIKESKVGNLIFFQGGPTRQARLTNRYQKLAKVPLLIAIDGEWGLPQRLDSTYAFPFNMTLGAIKDKSLLEKVGIQIGKHTKRMGMQFNFGPDVDININPKNPVIGFRAFGETKENVAESAVAFVKGFQSQGLFATGKHFPGHGDTDVDSHKALPYINLSAERIDNIELYPYKKLIASGLESVMIAHLNVPALEPSENTPSSVSKKIITDLLKTKMGFDGLIFTDALNMKAAANFRKPGEIDLEAFLAGNDLLLCPEDVPTAVEKLCIAYQDSIISEERLAYSVKKILKFKYKSGLNNYKPVDFNNLISDLNLPENEALQYQLYENAVTVLKNKNNILPIQNLQKTKIAYVKIGDDSNTQFLETLQKYTEITEVFDENLDSLNVKLQKFDKVIIGYHKSDKAWKKHDFSDKELLLIQEVAKKNVVILDAFVKPYALSQISNFDEIEAVVMSYQNRDVAQIVSAQIIFGAVDAKGSLPVSVGNYFKAGDGLSTQKINRLGFTSPENVNMNPEILNKIDAVAQKAIEGKMAPGISVLVARKGKVIFERAYGFFDYDNKTKVKTSDVFDVASMTKILATLPNVMQLYDKNRLNLDSKLADLLPFFKHSDKADINFKDLMTHYARLKAWEPFYKKTIDSAKIPLSKYYSKTRNAAFSKQVADSLFIRNDYHDTIMKYIIDSKLSPKKEYKYSDFTFIILKELIEKSLKKPLDEVCKNNIFDVIGANNSMFNPLDKFKKETIPPTEIDTYFRQQKIQGYVHDMAAAMFGGVSGHAGLFSNAIDVAKIMQMYLQKGNYGAHEFFSPKTFDDFNTCYFCAEGNRRGLGFDKPQLQGQQGPTCGCVSMESFGHTGFTGTMTWADPETEIVYVFLSNRTYPDSNAPNLLSKNNIREQIQQIIQNAIIK